MTAPYWQREPWTLYFDGAPPGPTPCKRHGFIDAEGGLCPSCVSYVLGSACDDIASVVAYLRAEAGECPSIDAPEYRRERYTTLTDAADSVENGTYRLLNHEEP